ncbi:hypothetical protein [Methylobacterium sp. PvR107]|uniref:hypothetical protein n=1 Tax=Methylobacterium sp. PvR107 TaxID=2806597 RepID=UPI001AE3BF61|nr:hypothetical protein [Methylobacterium sp. PvR107]MBP1182185.1 hypothetical protein [Methylobacterium sp. PvR107]
MSDDINECDAPKKLIGYLEIDIDPPTFLIPVFQDLDSDALLIQVAGINDEIISFDKAPPIIRKIVYPEIVIRRIGDPVLFGIFAGGSAPFFGNKEALKIKMKEHLDVGELEMTPAFASSVAKYVEDKNEVTRLKMKIFAETPANLVATRKFFLENNIIREDLYEAFPQDQHEIIAMTRISISGQQISIKIPETASQQIRRALGSRVSETFKKFTSLDSVSVSFEEDAHVESQIIQSIKAGQFDFDPAILDHPECRSYIYFKSSMILIPEAAERHLSYGLSQQNALDELLDPSIGIKAISFSTARRIVGAESVSLVSAMLFRYMIFGSLMDATHNTRFRLHAAIVSVDLSRLPEDYAQKLGSIYRRDLEPNEISKTSLLSLSMISFACRRLELELQRVGPAINMRVNSYYSPARMNRSFLEAWSLYCKDEFQTGHVDELTKFLPLGYDMLDG